MIFIQCTSILRSFGRLLGYETHLFLCSALTTSDMLNNICKAIVLSNGLYWIAFLNLNQLTSSLMSSLSSTLTQINERKEKILINNEELLTQFSSQQSSSHLFAYFAIIQGGRSNAAVAANTDTNEHDQKAASSSADLDSLKITRLNHELTMLSKDLFEKFRVVKTCVDVDLLKSFAYSNLIANGFSGASSSNLCAHLVELRDLYQYVLISKNNNLRKYLFFPPF